MAASSQSSLLSSPRPLSCRPRPKSRRQQQQQRRRDASWLLAGLASCALLSLLPAAGATQVHYIHWNSSNPIFRIDNTDHIFDVNAGVRPGEYDQANIICPVYKAGGMQPHEAEQYKIYAVSKEEYDTCRITNPDPRVIAVCNQPHKLMYFTITFRSFTPTPGGMEFQPGQDYYFISTSSSSDLERRVGGKCTTHNMKVMFKVAADEEEEEEDEPGPGHDAVPTFEAGGGEDSSYYYPPREVTLLDSNGVLRHREEEAEERRPGPNEDPRLLRQQRGQIIKQEASRMQQQGERRRDREHGGPTSSSSAQASRFLAHSSSSLALLFFLLLASHLLQSQMR